MSVCAQSGQTEEDSASEEAGAANLSSRDSYKAKQASKVVRVLTVVAYLLSVSLAAILLSVYYVCVWKSPEPPLQDNLDAAARRDTPHHKHHRYALHDTPPLTHGGGDTTVSEEVYSSPENITGLREDVDVFTTTIEPTPEDAPNTTGLPHNTTVLPHNTTTLPMLPYPSPQPRNATATNNT